MCLMSHLFLYGLNTSNLNMWYINIINLFFLMFGLYETSEGFLKMIYSIIKIKKEDKKNNNYAFIKELVLIISEIFA